MEVQKIYTVEKVVSVVKYLKATLAAAGKKHKKKTVLLSASLRRFFVSCMRDLKKRVLLSTEALEVKHIFEEKVNNSLITILNVPYRCS